VPIISGWNGEKIVNIGQQKPKTSPKICGNVFVSLGTLMQSTSRVSLTFVKSDSDSLRSSGDISCFIKSESETR